MTEIHVCKYKIIGSQFAVLTKEEAEYWVSIDPESRYYEPIIVKSISGFQLTPSPWLANGNHIDRLKAQEGEK